MDVPVVAQLILQGVILSRAASAPWRMCDSMFLWWHLRRLRDQRRFSSQSLDCLSAGAHEAPNLDRGSVSYRQSIWMRITKLAHAP